MSKNNRNKRSTTTVVLAVILLLFGLFAIGGSYWMQENEISQGAQEYENMTLELKQPSEDSKAETGVMDVPVEDDQTVTDASAEDAESIEDATEQTEAGEEPAAVTEDEADSDTQQDDQELSEHDNTDLKEPVTVPAESDQSSGKAPVVDKPVVQPGQSDSSGNTGADLNACKAINKDFIGWLQIPGTDVDYPVVLTNDVDYYFAEKGYLLKNLTAKNLQDYYTIQLDRVSANTVIHYHAIIHRALKYAVKMDMITGNPADKVERPKKDKFVGSFFDSKEINKLFAQIEGDTLEVPIKIGAFYGLRRSEILGLKWDAIDFDNNTITIRHTVTACNLDGKHVEVVGDTTKTKSSLRTLPLVPDFRELLLRKKAEQQRYRKLCGRSYCTQYLDYICVNEMGQRLKPNTLSAGFKRMLKKAGLRDIRLHDLRHSCASLLLANGVPMKQIQEWLGHSDFSTTANIYAHLDYQSKVSSAEAMLAGLGMGS